MIDDITIDESYRQKNRLRMDYFIPNYLEKFIHKSDEICSIGCGTGYDVELLNSMGYDTWGFDAGNRIIEWENRPSESQKKLKEGFAEDLPFGKRKFDFVYALEVIEHVGCKNGKWELLANYDEIRVRFLSSCLEMLKPKGRLIISTSNRLFPIDLGHTHHYNKVTNYVSKYGINFTIPWHPQNFIISFGDLRRILKKTKYYNELTIKQKSSLNYPSNSSKKYGTITKSLFNCILFMSSFYPFIRFNPILVALVIKNK